MPCSHSLIVRACELSSLIIPEAAIAVLTIKEVADKIVRLVDPKWGPAKRNSQGGPHVIICWDESHGLTECPEDQEWSVYSELRRALRAILESSILSIFLSTAGKFHKFSPTPEAEPSARAFKRGFSMLPPITAVGFDQFAEKVDSLKQEWSLQRIASTHYMAHLGRALCAYD